MNHNHKFRQLKVWQKSIVFVTSIYHLTSTFPKQEQFGLTDQIRRAAVSISLNIAEGSGSGSDPEFTRFLRIAQRSAYEVIAALEISINLKLTDQPKIEKLMNECDELGAMLSGLIKSLKAGSS